jgi:hypothetical protein
LLLRLRPIAIRFLIGCSSLWAAAAAVVVNFFARLNACVGVLEVAFWENAMGSAAV